MFQLKVWIEEKQVWILAVMDTHNMTLLPVIFQSPASMLLCLLLTALSSLGQALLPLLRGVLLSHSFALLHYWTHRYFKSSVVMIFSSWCPRIFLEILVACEMHQGVGNPSEPSCIQDDRANESLSPLWKLTYKRACTPFIQFRGSYRGVSGTIHGRKN